MSKELSIGDTITVRVKIHQGPHKDGGWWCLPCDDKGRTKLAKASHAAGHVFGMPMLILPEHIIRGKP